MSQIKRFRDLSTYLSLMVLSKKKSSMFLLFFFYFKNFSLIRDKLRIKRLVELYDTPYSMKPNLEWGRCT